MILSVCPNPSIDCYAWADEIKFGTVNRIQKLQEFPGGKGIHVALAIKELGGDSRIFGSWGGATGEWIKNACNKKDVEVSGISLEGNNRKCYTFRSSNSSFADTEVLEPGPELNLAQYEEFKKSFRREITSANMICLSGSWPQGAPKDAYSKLIEIANAEKKKTFLDCSGEQLAEALKYPFFGLHLNEIEAYNYCGSQNFEDLLNTLNGRVQLVAMTRGKEGLWMYYNGNIYVANVNINQVFSPVGSGDCLTAGIVYALEKGLKPEEVAAYGVACGAANCLHEELGMLKKQDVQKLLTSVECNIIKK